MKKGFSLVEVLIALVLSFFIIELLVSSFTYIKTNSNDDINQDLLSAFMLYEIFNVSVDIIVLDDSISFKYLEDQRELLLINNRLIIRPGTQIYFNNINEYEFFVKENYIYLKLKRNKKTYTYLIGELWKKDIF